jgi:hypothetical protein
MLSGGLIAFGITVGLVTGLSTHEGISGQLLTALFGFVGGGLMTYAGFRRKGEKSPLDPNRVGAGTLCFSLGVILGVAGGIGVREFGGRWFAHGEDPSEVRLTPAQFAELLTKVPPVPDANGPNASTKHAPPSGGSVFTGLHANIESPCQELREFVARSASPEARAGALERLGLSLCEAK